jgi:hypothetical protein
MREVGFEMRDSRYEIRDDSLVSPVAFRLSRVPHQASYRFFIALAIMCGVMVEIGSVSIAAEKPESLADKPVAAPQQNQSEPAEGPLRRRLLGATPEERARLEEERKRISAAAAAFGTDPTAIVGYYQVSYGHAALTNNLRIDTTTATVRVPVTPNWLLQVNMPYSWADLNQSSRFPLRGAGDMTMRTGGRLYASENVAFFIGTDASFPTASEMQLGTGKYTIGPGGAMAVPLARLQSLFFVLGQDFSSIGGDPSRADLHFTQVQSAVNTIWSERWWSLASMTWDVDWNHNRKSTMNLLFEVGHRFDKHWNFFAGPGLGVVGKDTPFGLDWTVQAGLRWVYATPLLPETLFGSMPMK